jgi:ATP-dependent RNA helicase DDX31/DBP7
LSVPAKDNCFKRRQRGAQKFHAIGPQELWEWATVLQTVFKDYVHSSQKMVSWAKKALQPFIWAYAIYPKELKSIFHIWSLYLGHVAKSFRLRDAPSSLSVCAVKKARFKRPDLQKKTQRRNHLVPAEVLHSEHSSGLEDSGTKGRRQGKQQGLQVAPSKPVPWREWSCFYILKAHHWPASFFCFFFF